MSIQPIGASFVNDNRAVSEVIGVVILFGFLILALSLYQVEVVPQQNAETEFQHSGEVRNDLVELRAGILQAGSIDQPQYQTVQLGTTYSTRVFSINPPSPAGTIRTTEAYPITISNGSGTPEGTITIPTRFIQYRPGYNELDRSPTWYDASVLYLDARQEGGGIAVIEDQSLVDSGEVQITALQNEFRKSGTGQVTVELRPAESVTGNIPEGDLNVTVPTRLSNGEYWDQTDIPSNKYSITDDANNDGIYNLTLETNSSNLTVDTVGIQEAPEAPTQNADASIGGGGGTDGGDGGDGGGGGGGGTDGGDGGDGGGGGGGGTDGFSTVSASDLPKNGDSSDQTLNFTVNSTLSNSESVTINLNDAEQGDFDYGSSSANLIGGSSSKGSVSITAQNTSAFKIEFNPNQDISSGEQIQLEVTSVSYKRGERGPAEVIFTRSDGVSATDKFSTV